jgi:hypothetical protein
MGDPRRLDWALDLLDLFIAAPSPDPGARDAFFETVSASIRKHLRRLEPGQTVLFKLLSEDLERGIPSFLSPLEGPAEEISTDTLTGKIVAIYTLDESSGRRAKLLMETIYEGVDVRISNDHVGTETLRSLAREADYFVVVTRSAKHAATEFIKAQRPDGKRELIYPLGKGSTSILSAIRKAVEL